MTCGGTCLCHPPPLLPPTTFMRSNPMFMKSCILWQLVKRIFTVLSLSKVSVKQKALKTEPVWQGKSLSFSKISWHFLYEDESLKRFPNLRETFQIMIEAVIRNNIACQKSISKKVLKDGKSCVFQIFAVL